MIEGGNTKLPPIEGSYSADELLKKAVEQGIINLDMLHEDMKKQEYNKLLSRHPYEVWQSKNGTWKTYLPHPIQGRVLKTRSSKKDLEDFIVSYYKEEEINPLFEVVFYEWLNSKMRYNEIKKQTYDRYKTDYLRFFPQYVRNMKISLIDEMFLEDFIKSSIADKGLTSKAYSGMRTILKGMFKYAYKQKYTNIKIGEFFINIDIAKKSFVRKSKNREKEVFTESEIKAMALYINSNPTIRNLGILLDMQTGLRVGELAALKKEDVHINERYIHIQRTEERYKDSDGKCVIGVREYPKNENADRYLLLSDSAIVTLKKILKLNMSCDYLLADGCKRITVNGFNHKIKRICQAVRIPERSMHKIRKSYATMLLDGDVDEAFILEQMGHADIKTTKQFYYYSNKDRKSRIEQLNNVMYF